MKRLNLVGQRFGKLTVLGPSCNDGSFTVWECACDCGKVIDVRTNNLRTGNTKSCGCERAVSKRKTHGQTDSRLYVIWERMRSRCNNPKSLDYRNYGGRGIAVCDEWQKHFEIFAEWARNAGYSDDLTIERINVNGNYEPNNCKWATKKEQANNTRSNIFLWFGGERLTLVQLSERVNIPYMRLYKRIRVRGVDVNTAVLMG